MSTLNPEVFPGKPVAKDAHRRSLTAAVVTSVIAVIIGLVYWSQIPEPVTETVITKQPSQAELQRAAVIQTMNENGVTVVSPAQRANVINQMKNVGTTKVSSSTRQSVLDSVLLNSK